MSWRVIPAIAQSPKPTSRRDGRDQHPVEPPDERGDGDRLLPPAGAEPLGRALTASITISRVIPGPRLGALMPKYCSKTRSAAGAAAVPPWPPFSISAQTTIVGSFAGP